MIVILRLMKSLGDKARIKDSDVKIVIFLSIEIIKMQLRLDPAYFDTSSLSS